MMNEKKNEQIDRLREQYAQDASAEMAAAVDADTATWETDTETERMIGSARRGEGPMLFSGITAARR
jgi:hypothetical protein